MAGFNNAPPTSEFHRHSSWGRTRRPKSITGADATAVVDVNSLAAAKAITDAIATASKAKPSSGVYSTENQRFLHLISVDGAQVSNIWVYHYASGRWSELVTAAGASIALAANTTKIVEIAGADLIAFNLVTDTTSVFAACSTF